MKKPLILKTSNKAVINPLEIPEIVTEVFKFLPTSTWSSVKRVCWQWRLIGDRVLDPEKVRGAYSRAFRGNSWPAVQFLYQKGLRPSDGDLWFLVLCDQPKTFLKLLDYPDTVISSKLFNDCLEVDRITYLTILIKKRWLQLDQAITTYKYSLSKGNFRLAKLLATWYVLDDETARYIIACHLVKDTSFTEKHLEVLKIILRFCTSDLSILLEVIFRKRITIYFALFLELVDVSRISLGSIDRILMDPVMSTEFLRRESCRFLDVLIVPFSSIVRLALPPWNRLVLWNLGKYFAFPLVIYPILISRKIIDSRTRTHSS